MALAPSQDSESLIQSVTIAKGFRTLQLMFVAPLVVFWMKRRTSIEESTRTFGSAKGLA
jgi:hypothetical protein